MNRNPIQLQDAELDELEFSASCKGKILWIPRDKEKHSETWSSLRRTACLAVELCQPSVRPLPHPSAGPLSRSCVTRVEAGCHQVAWEMVFIDRVPPTPRSPVSPYALVGELQLSVHGGEGSWQVQRK